MIHVQAAQLIHGKLVRTKDIRDAAELILAHLMVEPEFIRTAPHTIAGVTEWFNRKTFEEFWFADIDGKRVGMVGVSNHRYDGASEGCIREREICRLMVLPQARGIGVGSALFHTALADCGADRAWLSVLVGSKAEKMYRQWGWVTLGRVPSQDDPNDRIIAMGLNIDT